ncbi:ArnT family glycosyltransferase, partial [Patescibacteria group bacterium]
MAKNLGKKIIAHWQILLILLLAFGLRLYRLGQTIPSLFGDEVDTGYQAYSILKTGRDYFGNLFPIHFQSFGDWRMPLYIYFEVLFVAVLGLTNLAVRLPALVFSVGSILFTYLVVLQLLGEKRLALLTSLFLVFSPWHFHFSRLGLEVSLFLLLFLVGLWFFLKEASKRNLFWSAFFWGLCVYTYSTAKLFLPIFLLCLQWLGRLRGKRKLLFFKLPLLLVVLPMVWATFFGQGRARFGSISIFADPKLVEEVNLARQEGELSSNWERVFHNKPLIYGKSFLKNYLASFSTQYLFLRGDPSFRHNPTAGGQLYSYLAPLIIGGAYFLVQKYSQTKNTNLLIPFLIIFLTPLPAALTQGGGTHAIRTYQSLPWWQFLAAVGFFALAGVI